MPALRTTISHEIVQKNIDQIPAVFGAAQHAVSTHRRSVAALHKILAVCAQYTTDDGKHVRLTGEKEFMLAFRACVDHLLDVKKGVVQVDRVVKFIVAFFAHANELKRKDGDKEEEEEEDEEDTPSSRLATAILKHLLKGCPAANKHVRFRCTQIAAQLISVMPEIDEDLFVALKEALLLRARDKEPNVRVQAVVGLAKLQVAEDDSEDSEENEESPTQTLARLVATDPSAEVRRAALFHLDLLDPSLLPGILERTRDVDINNRRFVYQAKLAEVAYTNIPTDQRLALLKHGLRDREDAVKRSAGRLLAKWVGDDIYTFVKSFDLVAASSDGNSDSIATVAEAIRSVLTNREDLAASLEFDDAFWDSLTPESALVAQATISYWHKEEQTEKFDSQMPTATSLALRIETQWQKLRSSDEVELDLDNPSTQETIFVLDQLLKLALLCDYSDEAGRRKMMDGFMDTHDQREGGVRSMIRDPQLPLTLIGPCFDLLYKLLPQDAAYMQVVLETMHWLQETLGIADETVIKTEVEEAEASDSDLDDHEVQDLLTTPRKQAVEKEKAPPKPAPLPSLPIDDTSKIDGHLRCLHIVRALLERVSTSLTESQILRAIRDTVIVPAVRTKNEDIRELGIICLGLCALLDRDTAIESFGLFVQQAGATEGDMQESVYKIIFDILIINGLDFLLEKKDRPPELVIEYIVSALEQEPRIQAIAASGMAKLMLSGLLNDSEVLRKLAIVYFAPETVDNTELRQCLSYFFPAYCYSSPANQRRMQQILINTLDTLINAYEGADDTDGLLLPNQMALQLIDWVDPTKAIEQSGLPSDPTIHADLALDLLKEIFQRSTKDDRKRLVQLLGRLYLPPEMDEWKIRSLLLLISKIQEDRPLGDSVSRNALIRFATSVAKTYGERAEVLDDEEIQDVEHFNQVATWVEQEAQARAEAEEAKPAKPKRRSTAPKARRARSRSTAASESSMDDEEGAPIATNLPPRRSTRRRTSTANKEETNATQAQLSKLLEAAGLEDSEEDGLEDVVEEDEEDD